MNCQYSILGVPNFELYQSFQKLTLKSFLILIVLLVGIVDAYAQSDEQNDFNYTGFAEIGLTSPTAASLGEFGSVPVSMATGIPSISIPITTITAGELSVPVSLNYHAGGIKVTEYASQVGLGWSLNAGGVITRVVNGLPDELSESGWEGYFTNSDIINAHSDIFFDYWYEPVIDSGTGDTTHWEFEYDLYNEFLIEMAQNRVDAEADVYFYNFGEYSGFFVMDGQGEFVAFPDVNIGVQYTLTPQGLYDSQNILDFTITLQNGQQYYFSDMELSVKLSTSDDQPGGQFPNTLDYPYNYIHPTAWYLSEISSPQQERTITFEYESVTNSNDILSIGASTLTNYLDSDGSGTACTNDSYTISTSLSKSKVQSYVRLTDIEVSGGEGRSLSVTYETDTNNYPIEYKISNLNLYNEVGSAIKAFDLEYEYDTGVGQLLLLDSVKEVLLNDIVSSDSIPPYKFTYELGIQVGRESIDRDFLGYPRPDRGTFVNHLFGDVVAEDGDTGIGATREPNLSYTLDGVLHKIEYPTGGYTEFEYELNTAMVDSIETDIGGLRIKEITSNALDPESDPIVKTYKYGEGDIGGFASFIKRGGIFEIKTYKVVDFEECKLESGVSNPESPLFGHFVQYDYVTEFIDGGEGGARTEVYDTILDGTNSETYFGGGSDGVVYKRALPLFERIQVRADSLERSTNNYQYLTIKETETEYEILDGESVGGYFSDITSLLWRRPNIHITEFTSTGAQGAVWQRDTLWTTQSGTYQRMWAYPIKKTNREYEYEWYEDTTVWDEILYDQQGNPITADESYDSSRYDTSGIMSSFTEYEYHSVHKQLEKETTTNSDGTKLITSYEYAHDYYSGLIDSTGDFNPMLISIPYSITRENSSGDDLSKSWVTWSSSISGASGLWKPYELWVWEGNNSGDVTAPTDPTSEAIRKARIDSYNSHDNPLEVTDVNGNKIKYFYGSNSTPFSQDGHSGSYGQTDGIFLTGIQKQFGTLDAISGGVRPSGGDDVYTEATYDDLGRIETITDQNEQTSSFDYDGFGRLVSQFNPNGFISASNGYSYSSNLNGGSYVTTSPNFVENIIYTEPIYATDFSSSSGWSSVNSTYNVFGVEIAGETTVKMGSSSTSVWEGINIPLSEPDLIARVDFYPDATTGGTPHIFFDSDGHRFAVQYLPGSDEFRLQYRMNSSSFIYPFTFPMDAPIARWYTIELHKEGSTFTAWVYPKGQGRNTSNMYSVSGFSSSWAPKFQLSGNDSYFYAANLHISKSWQSSITYLDGLGRSIQTQTRAGNEAIIAGSLYNEEGLAHVSSRPIQESGVSGYISDLFNGTGSFNPGNALPSSSPIEDYYDPFFSGDEDYAYSYTQFEDMPTNRPVSSRMPGSTAAVTSMKYGLNSTETFTVDGTTWNAYELAKTTTTDPEGNSTISYTDGLGRTIVSGVDMDGDGALSGSTDLITKFGYDELGRLDYVADPRGIETTYDYNQLGQLVGKQLDDQTHPHLYIYDDKGRPRFHRDPNLDAANDYYYYTKYDDLDRPTEIGRYNSSGSISDSNINDQSFPGSSYDVYITNYYDGNGAYSGHTPNNVHGRLTRATFKDPNGSYSGHKWYSYNELGLVEWVIQAPAEPTSSKNVKIEYTYDELGRLTRVYFNPLSSSTDDHYFWYYYDEFGRLEELTSYGSNDENAALTEAEYTYFADGSVDQLILGGGAQTVDYDYTIQGWLDQINDPASMGTDAFAADLNYQLNGNISQQSWEQAAFSTATYNYYYDYDAANRLTDACYGGTTCDGGAFDVSYGYLKNGAMDWINREDDGGDLLEYDHTYESGTNRLDYVAVDGISGETQSVTRQFSHDANGNATENGVQGITSTTYDWRNLPTQVVANSTTINYIYDAEGNRVRKAISGGETTWYVRGADRQTIAAYDGSGNLLFLNILAGGQIIGQIEN